MSGQGILLFKGGDLSELAFDRLKGTGLRKCLSIISLLGLLSACISSNTIQYSVADWGRNTLQIKTEVFKPDGPGPFPAVIVLHGSDGVSDNHRRWATRLVSWGYVAIIPDSFNPRGRRSIMTDSTAISGDVRVADVIGAAKWLNDQPYVVRNHIGLIGFSHGGWTIMRAVQESNHPETSGIKGAVAYYPLCDAVSDGGVSIPLLILIGDDDDWTPAERCRTLQKTSLKRPDLTEMVFYPDTYHSFDIPGGTRWVNGLSTDGVRPRRIENNLVSTADAEKRTRNFFARVIGP